MRKRLGLVLGLGLLGAGTARAEGFRLYGMSAAGQMRGEALVASVQGAEANWYNPAALSVPAGEGAFSTGVNLLVVNAAYTPAAGQSLKNDDRNFPLPYFYFTHRLNGRVAMGLGVNTPFGLSTRYNNDAPFSYLTTGGRIQVLNLSPNMAVRVSDRVAVGIGLNHYRSSAELRQVVPYSLSSPGEADSPLRIDGTGNGTGVNTGVLVTVSDTQRVGVTYKSEVAIDYDGGHARLDNAPFINQPYQTHVRTRVRFPGMVGVGWAIRPDDRWRVEVGGQWTEWRTVDRVDVHFSDNTFLPDAVTRFDWKNTWTARVGVTRRVAEAWEVSGGYFYTTSPTRESTYTPLVPDGNHHVVSGGGRYEKGGLSVEMPVVLIFQTGRSHIQNAIAVGPQNVNGDYALFAYQLGLSVGWRF